MARVADKTTKLSRRRALTLAVLMLLVFGVYGLRLFQIQIVEGEAYANIYEGSRSRKSTIAAARGEILDRNLRPIAVNRTSLSLVFDYDYFPRGSTEEKREQQNTIILSLATLLKAANESWNESLPITDTVPYTFEKERDTAVASLKKTLRMADYATADNCMGELIKRYALQTYTAAEQRILAGVQYEMELRQFSSANPFVFSGDISKETSYKILENNRTYPGVDVQTVPVREYVSGDTGAHLMGTVGPIFAEEFAELKKKGYKYNDTIGRGGIEAAMESELRGTTGTTTIIKNARGKIVNKYESKAPVPGDSVILTLDLELQATAQKAINDKIAALRAQKVSSSQHKGQDVKSGAIVLLDVSNGGVLVSASWPNFDLSTYSEQYGELINDPERPLFNRALNGLYPCGSTMKPAVACAALDYGIIAAGSHPIACHKVYTPYEGYSYKCLGYHGSITVATALEKSCNIFFYEVGRRLGITKMNEYSTLFGLGQKTGIEVGESAGVLAGPKYRESLGKQWYEGDTIQAAIGQSDNLFTPIQLAAYAMTLANDGVRYKTHLVQATRSYDGKETIVEKEVAATVPLKAETIRTVREGMIAVAKTGTAASFRTASYTIAAKTGTAQVGVTRSDHGAFIAYAPVEKPEVAIGVLMENGTSAAAKDVARVVLDAYFRAKTSGPTSTPMEELLP